MELALTNPFADLMKDEFARAAFETASEVVFNAETEEEAEALVFQQAIKEIAYALKDMMRSFVKMITFAEWHKIYVPLGYESLRYWVADVFDQVVGSEYTWDYVSRFIPFAETMANAMRRGYQQEAEQALATAKMSVMRDAGYVARMADEAGGDRPAELINMLANPELKKTELNLFKQELTVELGAREQNTDPTTLTVKKPVVNWRSSQNGFVIEAEVNGQQLSMIQAMLGHAVEFRMG